MSCESDEWTQLSEISLAARLERAEKTLEYAGYTYCGGELWKPPLGPSAKPLLEHIDSLEQERDKLAAQLRAALNEIEFWRSEGRVNAAADTYFMLCLECEIAEGGSLVEYVERLRRERGELVRVDKAVNDVDAA